MSKIRAMLVDDEEPARERLKQLLAGRDDVEIVGEAEDGEQAIERIEQLAPDLVFLDIQMPGCSGTEVVASLPAPRPKIVFCTAYDEFAVDAFELHAVDYLLKPVSRARLAKALARMAEQSADDDEPGLDRVGRAASEGPARFLAKRGTRHFVVPSGDVIWFGSEGGLTKLQTGEHRYWMQPTLNELENRLDPAGFFRVSRAAIVNLDEVREVQPDSSGCGEVILSNGDTLEVSRRRFRDLLTRLQK